MEKWIGDCIGKMHIHGINQTEVANEIGIRRDYFNKILNGKLKPKNARKRIENAIDTLIMQKSEKQLNRTRKDS